MKKKICGLFICICLFLSSLFSFAGCSVVNVDKTKENSETAVIVGDINLSKGDLISLFYSYYQSNQNYFSLYGTDDIEESFYTWVLCRQIVTEKANQALESGIIFYTEDDEKEVWDGLLGYFRNQVSTYEKAIYEKDGYEEDNYPAWLKDETNDDETTTYFESFKSAVSEVEYRNNVAVRAQKQTNEQVAARLAEVKASIFNYVSTDDEGNETTIDIDETDYIVGARNQAYANYMQYLISNAKGKGDSTNKNDVLIAEMQRVYDAYYSSQIQAIFQKYYTDYYLIQRDTDALGSLAVVEKYLEAFFADEQTYQSENSYVSTMTNSDGANLVLYNYEGKEYFFTVQHILVAFTDVLNDLVKEIPGYPTSSYDVGELISEYYKTKRDEIVGEHEKAILTKVNVDAARDSLAIFGNYYYFDETKKDVYSDAEHIYDGYVQLTTYSYNATTNTLEFNDIVDRSQYNEDDVVFMATVDDVIGAYKANYVFWANLAEQVYNGKTVATLIEENPDLNEGVFEDLGYVLDLAKNKSTFNNNVTELRKKIASLLFIELEWQYSGDKLGNEISNKMGYVISSMADENGSWVPEFALGSRQLLEELNNLTAEEVATYLENGDVDKLVKKVLTNYGYHIIEIGDIHENGASIIDLASTDLDGLTFALTKDSAYVQALANMMRKTFVSNGSNETIYDYYYEELYSELTSNSAYFLAKQYKWLSEYNDAGKINIVCQMTYDELMDAIQN